MAKKKDEMESILERMGLKTVSNQSGDNKEGKVQQRSKKRNVTTTATSTGSVSSHPNKERRRKPTLQSSLFQRKQLSLTTTLDADRNDVKSRVSPSHDTTKVSIDLSTQLNYARNGHAVLRSFLDANMLQQLRIELEQYAEQHQIDAWRQKVEVQSGSSELAHSCKTIPDCRKVLRNYLPDPEQHSLPFLQYFNTWKSLSKIRQSLTHSSRLAHAASILMDCPSIRLYQDSLFCKYAADNEKQQPPPGGSGPTPWHADARMAPFDTSNMITFWIPFQRTTHTGLVFCSKSHSDFSLPFWNPIDSAVWDNLENRYPPATSIVDYMPLEVGDVTVHSGWTLHCADPANRKEGRCRMALAITYVDARATIRHNAVMQNGNTLDKRSKKSPVVGYGDMEDFWSYRDWIDQVPHSQPFIHKLVPIVWPPSSNI